MTDRTDAARRAFRKVLRDARDVNEWRKIVRFRLWMPVALQLLMIGAVLVYATSRFPGFVNAANLTSVLLLAAPLAAVAIGQTHALLVGSLDLSVGAMVTFGVVIASFHLGPEATDAELLRGVGLIFLGGLAVGVVNAALVVWVKIPSIIATLATLSILNGISLALRETPGGVIDRDFTSTFKSGLGPIPVSFLVILIAAAALDAWLYGSGSGLRVRSVGFDERSAKRNGVRTKWVRARALILSSAFATIAAFLVMARSSVGNAAIGESYALDSITAAVLGGAALSGGRATFLGAVVASVLLALILVVLPFLGLSSEHGLMIVGRPRPAGHRPVPGRRHQGAREAQLQARPAACDREPAPQGGRDPRPVPAGSGLRGGADGTGP